MNPWFTESSLTEGTGVVSARAVALSEGVLQAMLMTKLKISAAFLAGVCAITLGSSAMRPSLAAAPAQERKKADPKDGTAVKGTLVGVDADKNTVTIAVTSFDRKTGEGGATNKTFAVGKDATILQDEGK